MKLLTLTIFFSFTAFVIACSEKTPSKTIQEVLDHEQFDTNIIRRLPLYDSLKNILIVNIDTIFNYRNAKTKVINGVDSIEIEDLSYGFIYMPDKGESSDKISLETLPPPIFLKIDSLCHQIGQNRIYAFNLERGIIRIEMKLKYISDEETNAETYHLLRWNFSQRADKNSLEKDTALGNGWIYDIYIEEWKGR
jgi:hypothetical protein